MPVGLIRTAWGGTPAEAWTPQLVLEGHPERPTILKEYEKVVAADSPERAVVTCQKSLANWSDAVAKAKAEECVFPKRPHKPEPPAEKPQWPFCLYNAMIPPLVPYAILPATQNSTEILFPAMIRSWRHAWGLGGFPFLFVQIAPHQHRVPDIRKAQLVAWKMTPKTAIVVIPDVGGKTDIPPRKKEAVGQRLALAARAIAYGEKIVYSGPVFRAMTVHGNGAVLEFDHIGFGLMAAEGGLTDFVVASLVSTNFVRAAAVIKGDRVAVTSRRTCPRARCAMAGRTGSSAACSTRTAGDAVSVRPHLVITVPAPANLPPRRAAVARRPAPSRLCPPRF